MNLKDLPPATAALSAIVYCEGEFGRIDGKTANGLVRHSEKYEIRAIIDGTKAGQDAGMVLDGVKQNIPIFANLAGAIQHNGDLPDSFIYGMAPASGMLSTFERGVVLEAIGLGINIVNGLHEFLNDDPEFVAAAMAANVTMRDVRMPRPKKLLRTFSGKLANTSCKRIAVLGTDCAIGKRTTAAILTNALNNRGIKTVLVGTGQTGLMQGAQYGLAMDAVPSQFCAGELEATILEAYENEAPEVIIIEGQGALSHPAYSTSSFILRGSVPHAVILQHAPGRPSRVDFDWMEMPEPANEIQLIQAFANTRVIGLTINHENMSESEVAAAEVQYQTELGIPVTDALWRSPNNLVDIVLTAFPELVNAPRTSEIAAPSSAS